MREQAERRLLVKVIAPRSARVLEAEYIMNPFDSLPFALTSSTARSFQSSSVYSGSVLDTPTETVEEKMMTRLMLPLGSSKKVV